MVLDGSRFSDRGVDGRSRGLRRVVVTGGAGFVGSWLCEHLLNSGTAIVCVDNFLTGSVDNVRELCARESFELLTADVCDVFDVPGRVDAVLHLASPASPVHYLKLPLETLRAGSVGTMNALGLAERKGARFLLASTSEVYGDPLVHPQPESYWGNVNPVGPRSVYDEAKRFAEALTVAYGAQHGMTVSIARIFNTYGPRMRTDDGRAIPAFLSQALCGEPLTVAGDGTQTRTLCYVQDTVEGLVKLLHSGSRGPVNIGGCEELTIGELAQRIRELARSTSDIEYVGQPVDDPRVRRPDLTAAAELLDWRPRVPLETGLARTLSWFARELGVELAEQLVE